MKNLVAITYNLIDNTSSRALGKVNDLRASHNTLVISMFVVTRINKANMITIKEFPVRAFVYRNYHFLVNFPVHPRFLAHGLQYITASSGHPSL